MTSRRYAACTLPYLIEDFHDLSVITLQQFITGLHVFGVQHGGHTVSERTEHVLEKIYACLNNMFDKNVKSILRIDGFYMNSGRIHSVFVHIIQVDRKNCTMPVQETAVALHFDSEERGYPIMQLQPIQRSHRTESKSTVANRN